jgi:hypothetical protein
MRLGFAKSDVTPRVGVELCGFGPYLNRRSIGVRDRLWARAMAVQQDGATVVLISNDLIGVSGDTTARVRQLVHEATGVPPGAVMVHCTHTHSGPTTIPINGWAAADVPYLETLPQRIAAAGVQAVANLQEATLSYAEAPCEGVAVNREYDHDAQPLEDVLRDDWRPAKPELTDTTCHVLTAHAGDRLIGFASYFGCHPVVCCEATRYIHGDYAGVATNSLEREHPGSVGLFLQGALGDVNTCVVHKPEPESLLALDVIASRYANAVRRGLAEAQPLAVDEVRYALRPVTFTRKPLTVDDLRARLAEQDRILQAPDATDVSPEVRMAAVYALAYRALIAALDAGRSVAEPTELQGFRLGSLSFLGAPFEIFQAIKNEVRDAAKPATTFVMGPTDDCLGYAPDRTAAARGGYAADTVPLMLGMMPYASIHDELVRELSALEGGLR